MDNGEVAFRELWQWLVSKWEIISLFPENSWPVKTIKEGLELAQSLEDKYLKSSEVATPEGSEFDPEVCKQCGAGKEWLFKTIKSKEEWNIVRCISCGIIYRQRMYKEWNDEFWETEDILTPYPPEIVGNKEK